MITLFGICLWICPQEKKDLDPYIINGLCNPALHYTAFITALRIKKIKRSHTVPKYSESAQKNLACLGLCNSTLVYPACF